MDQLKLIQRPVQKELDLFQDKLRQSVKSDVALLDQIMRYILKKKGKRVRPLLVFLSAGSLGEIVERTHNGAALVEILHTATLVHDDVVDEAEKRRGIFSINALWKTKVAVLVGDFLLSKGLLLALDNKDYASLHLLSEAVRDMSEGELFQIKKSRTLDITEDDYLQIINAKTASLLGVSAAVGAASVTKDPEMIQRFKSFGRTIGMAFQIKDDLFDYGQNDVGKPLGIDIAQKKMTLPLINTLTKVDRRTRRFLLSTVKKDNPSSKDKKQLLNIVHQEGGIEYASERMLRYRNEALALLEDLPESDCKQSLISISHYIVDRKK
jgi:octaprenyl-diphosphate synthase